jgi:transcriptional regulator with XRE-family HTH domain
MNKAMPLSDWLRERKLSQVELARQLNVSPNTVNRWLGGAHRPGWRTMQRLAELTEGCVTADSFLPDQQRVAA